MPVILKFSINLVTDSTADIPPELCERYNIRVVPVGLALGKESYRDGVDMTRDEFYRRLATFNPLPTTAAPAAGEFEALYESLPPRPILSIHLAATLSGVFNAARLGAEKFGDRVRVIDSGSLSMGSGWQVIAAAETIAAGNDLPAVLDVIDSTRRRVRVLAILDTLDNLRRSGRISLIRASLGTLLQIKPLIEVAQGQVNLISQQRTRQKAMAAFRDLVRSLGALERLAVLYTDNPAPAVALRDQLAVQIAPQAGTPLLTVQITPALGVHIGPGAVGVAAVVANA